MVVEHVHNRILDGELAKERGDLELVLDDLDHVKACSEHLVTTFSKADFIEKAILDSALIRYRRCFNTSVRAALVPNFSVEESLLAEKHRYFRDLADKYVAHSVNSFENSGATISVSFTESDEIHLGRSIGISKSIVTMISLNDLHALIFLAEHWRKNAKTRIDELDRALLHQMKYMGVEGILSLQRHLPEISDATKNRKYK